MTSRTEGDAVARAMHAITALIAARRLVPGQPVRQEELSQRLSLSRGPIREALKALSAQQIVSYSRNRGYFVAQFSAADMEQLYKLRAFAEGELLRSVRAPTAAQLRRLRTLNERMLESQDEDLSRQNEEFHFTIYRLSPQRVILAEVDRWWKMSAGYRSMSLSVGAREPMIADHAEMIEALEALDRERLVEISDRHRARSATYLLPLLPPA